RLTTRLRRVRDQPNAGDLAFDRLQGAGARHLLQRLLVHRGNGHRQLAPVRRLGHARHDDFLETKRVGGELEILLLLAGREAHRPRHRLVTDVASGQDHLLPVDGVGADRQRVGPVGLSDGAKIGVRHHDVGAAEGLTALFPFIIPAPATAQGAVRGKVVDSEVGTPISGATVQVGKDGPTVKTDSAGVFLAQKVTAGVQELNIKVIGYEPGVFDVTIHNSVTVDGIFPLDFNGYQLPAVVVEARAEALVQRYGEFEHRRHLRLGTYLR